MQVVHPNPTTLNRSCCRAGITPAFLKYSVTTFEPGARLVLTHGLDDRPWATAFLASRPASSIPLGFEVLLQPVIAAMTTEPCRIENFSPFISTGTLEF